MLVLFALGLGITSASYLDKNAGNSADRLKPRENGLGRDYAQLKRSRQLCLGGFSTGRFSTEIIILRSGRSGIANACKGIPEQKCASTCRGAARCLRHPSPPAFLLQPRKLITGKILRKSRTNYSARPHRRRHMSNCQLFAFGTGGLGFFFPITVITAIVYRRRLPISRRTARL